MNLDGIELNDSLGLNPSASEFVPSTPPHFLPRNSTPGVQTAASITALDAIWKSPSKPSSPQSNKKLIKFVQNVHFPKDFLNKCLKVLPPDVSLADVKYQPENFQEKWFDYLKQKQLKTVEEPKAANEEEKKSLLRDNFTEDERFKKYHKGIKFLPVSKFVSTTAQVEVDDRINKKFEDLSFLCGDYKEELTALQSKINKL